MTKWRDVIRIHPATEAFSRLDGQEFEIVAASIKALGLQHPVKVMRDESGNTMILLDGITRLDALEKNGVELIENGELRWKYHDRTRNEDFTVFELVYPKDEADTVALIYSFNDHRRHSSAKSRKGTREKIAALLKANPARSDRSIGKLVGGHHTTVGTVREELEEKGDVAKLAASVDTKGRKQPRCRTRKQKKPQVEQVVPRAAGAPVAGNDVDAAETADRVRGLFAADDLQGTPAEAASNAGPQEPPDQAQEPEPPDEAEAKVSEPADALEARLTNGTSEVVPVNDIPAEPVTGEPKAEPTVEEAEAELKRLKALKAKINANTGDQAKINPETSARAFAEFKVACETLLPKMQGDDLQEAVAHFAEVVEVPAEELMPDLKRAQIDVKIAKAEVTALKRKLAGKLPPRESRAARWQRHADGAYSSVEELISMQQEFAEAKEEQPDSLQAAPFAQKCDAICDIDLENVLSTLEEAANAEVPLGFGRD